MGLYGYRQPRQNGCPEKMRPSTLDLISECAGD
jgi:hypothetical protein